MRISKLVFQKREETEASRKYPNLMPPWVKQFKGEMDPLKIGVKTLREVVLQECEKKEDIDPEGEWRVLVYGGGRPFVIKLGDCR